MRLLPDVINGFSIIEDFGYTNGSRRASVICKVCFRKYETDPNKLVYRKHCGCIRNGTRVCKYAKNKRLMQVYKHMRSRCYNVNNKDYHNYGGKGITICAEWKDKPDIFCKWALENGYKENLTIDRIDSNKSYAPLNCRWADSKTQGRNTSRNVLTMELAESIRKDRLTMTYQKLVDKYKVSRSTIYLVVKNLTWTA